MGLYLFSENNSKSFPFFQIKSSDYIYIYIFHDIYTHIYFGNSLENKKVEFVEIRIQDTDIFLCKIFENLNIYIN